MKQIFVFILYFTVTCVANSASQVELPGYILPKNKQGIADRNYNLLNEERYRVFEKELTFGIQKYNFYWRDAEDKVFSSNKPLTCPVGYSLFPQNKKEKQLIRIKKYHCYKNTFIQKWEKRFKQNAKHHIQLALVLWTAPRMYIDKGCEGFYSKLQKRHLMGGCYPAPDYYDDYEDWIRFIAFRFGKYVDHYIVWNEIDSTNWADTSTLKYSKVLMKKDLKFHMDRSFAIYTTLFKKTIKAIDDVDNQCLDFKGECKNFIYISLTRDWYSRKLKVYQNKKNRVVHIRWRNMNLLDHIWKELGLKYNWSIAVHPYGNVYEKNATSLRFSTLNQLSKYQRIQINAHKNNKRSWLSYPQSRLFASEQNAGHRIETEDWKRKAKYICESYDVAFRMPEIIAITHNHFQDNIQHKTTRYTMLPTNISMNLKDAEKYETFQAYQSTALHIWGRTNEHYCCKKYRLGCAVGNSLDLIKNNITDANFSNLKKQKDLNKKD